MTNSAADLLRNPMPPSHKMEGVARESNDKLLRTAGQIAQLILTYADDPVSRDALRVALETYDLVASARFNQTYLINAGVYHSTYTPPADLIAHHIKGFLEAQEAIEPSFKRARMLFEAHAAEGKAFADAIYASWSRE